MAEQFYDEDSFDEFVRLLDDEDFRRAINELPDLLPECIYIESANTHEELKQNTDEKQSMNQAVEKQCSDPPVIKTPIAPARNLTENEIIDISKSTTDNNTKP